MSDAAANSKAMAHALLGSIRAICQRAVDAAIAPIKESLANISARIDVPGNAKSASAEEVADAMVEKLTVKHTTWLMERERELREWHQRLFELSPKPKDGKDGRDGLGFDDLSVEQIDERHIVIRFTRGDVVKEFPVELAGFVDRGVFKDGESYERGDSVSWGGSTFFAQKRNPAGEPGASPDWRLGVKRGRDGKDGVVKTIDPHPTVKIAK